MEFKTTVLSLSTTFKTTEVQEVPVWKWHRQIIAIILKQDASCASHNRNWPANLTGALQQISQKNKCKENWTQT